jgi:hypothetical protein
MPFPDAPTATLAGLRHSVLRQRPAESDYRPFPDESGRNNRQATIEIPVMVRALRLPTGGRVLEVGCGRGVDIARAAEALAEIARVLSPGGLFVHETPVSQLIAHPVRSFGRRMPWRSAPAFERHRTALLWTARRRAAYGCLQAAPSRAMNSSATAGPQVPAA